MIGADEPGDRRGADHAAGGAARGDAGQGHAAADREPRPARDARRLPRAADRVPARARSRAVRRGPQPDRSEPDARVRRDRPGHPRGDGGAPKLLDALAAEDAEHFAAVRELLDAAGIPYEVDPTLVRGLDYYTRTLFEFTSDALGAQSGVGGGGRYDRLIEQLGGQPTRPACGWAAGVERILLAGAGAADRARSGRPARRGRLAMARQRNRCRVRPCPRGAARRPRGAARPDGPLAEERAQARGPARRSLRCDRARRDDRELKDMASGEQQELSLAAAIPAILRGSRLVMKQAPRANGYRDAWCGELTAARAGSQARVAGWVHRRRDHGGLIFIDLRDRSGIVQLVFHPDSAPEAHAAAHALRSEDVMSAHGARRQARAGERQPEHRDRRDRARGRRDRDPRRRRHAAIPGRRGRRGRRDPAPAPPPARPAPHADAGGARAAPPRRPDDARGPRRARLPRDRDAVPDALDPGGRARLPRSRADRSPARSTRCRSRRSCSSRC